MRPLTTSWGLLRGTPPSYLLATSSGAESRLSDNFPGPLRSCPAARVSGLADDSGLPATFVGPVPFSYAKLACLTCTPCYLAT